MNRLILFLLATIALVTPVSAEIIPGCQWLADAFPKYYVIEQANVRNAPNSHGIILATLPPGSVVYTNEKTRTAEENPEGWYATLATKSLPAFSGCSGGFIHPSRLSKTRQQAQQSSDSRSWGAYAETGEDWEGQGFGLSWNYNNPEAAANSAFELCKEAPDPEGCPKYMFVFSTNVRSDQHDTRVNIAGFENVTLMRKRCILVSEDVYEGGGGDVVRMFYDSEDEARRAYEEDQIRESNLYIGDKLHKIACNDH